MMAFNRYLTYKCVRCKQKNKKLFLKIYSSLFCLFLYLFLQVSGSTFRAKAEKISPYLDDYRYSYSGL